MAVSSHHIAVTYLSLKYLQILTYSIILSAVEVATSIYYLILRSHHKFNTKGVLLITAEPSPLPIYYTLTSANDAYAKHFHVAVYNLTQTKKQCDQLN
jgi:hypothetical protein